MKTKLTLLFSCFFITVFTNDLKAQAITLSYEECIDSIVRIAHDYVGFNGTVLVGNDTKIVYQKSFGFGDKDKNVALTPEYRFSPGSIDKEFTTVAIMLLKQQGRISYDDKLSKYLPDLPNWAKQVQIKHILTHTSGLPDIRYGRNLTTEGAIQQLMGVEQLEYEPGKDFGYGNLHSVLRTMVIEKVSSQSQDTFIKEHIFIPAGMEQAFSKTSLDMNRPLVASGSLPMSVAGIDMYVTAQDLYRWLKALWNGNIINLESLKEALTPHELSGELDRAIFDFGYFTKNNDGEILELFHDGTHPSHYTFQSLNFDTKLIIVLLSSDGNKATLSSLHRAIKKLAKNPVIEIPDAWWLNNEAKLYGYPTAIKTYKSMVDNGDKVKPKESLLNGMGYALSNKTSIKDALLLLKLNLEFYPSSANAHDSYAEVLIRAGKYQEAKSIAESGLKLAKQSENDFLIRSLTSYLDKIDTVHLEN
ncbi:MAG: serine hydrolase domain-containing protein [Bacteroidota bacterium]